MNKFKAIRHLLDLQGKSVMGMAKYCNCSRDNIYKTLNSKVTKYDNPTMVKIADFFEISVGEIIDLSITFKDEES